MFGGGISCGINFDKYDNIQVKVCINAFFFFLCNIFYSEMCVRMLTSDKPEGRRRAGRPNLRWMDGVMRDAEKLGIRNWRTKPRDRDGWRRLLESAKTLHGL